MKNKNDDLYELVKSYYPKSDRARKEFRELARRVEYPYVVGLILFIQAFGKLILSIQEVGRLDKEAGMISSKTVSTVSSAILIPIIFALFAFIVSGIWAALGRSDWLWLRSMMAKLKWRIHLRRAFASPYSSHLIIGTVEAIEAEIGEKEASAETLILHRRSTLEGHIPKLESVRASIKERLIGESYEPRRIILQSRLSVVEVAFNEIAVELDEVDKCRQELEDSVKPVKKTIQSLRGHYGEALEMEVIVGALAEVRDEKVRGAIRSELLQVKSDATLAFERISQISRHLDSMTRAVQEVEALGIDTTSAR